MCEICYTLFISLTQLVLNCNCRNKLELSTGHQCPHNWVSVTKGQHQVIKGKKLGSQYVSIIWVFIKNQSGGDNLVKADTI